MIKCPRCNGLLISENKHLHCVMCARDFNLVPSRGEKRRLEIVKASRSNDHKDGNPILPGQRG